MQKGVVAQVRIDEPNERQKLFLKAKKKYIGFGGARGGGKSWSVRTKAVLLASNYPGIRILIVRRSYPELVNNHIRILRTQLTGVAKYNDKDKVLTFRNGSTINFTYCDNDRDLDRMQGVEYDIIFLDEATQLSEYQIKTIAACLRGVNSFPKRMYLTMNPGGQGHQYIKRVFIDRKFEPNEDPDDYVFIQSLVTDNKALMEEQPDYIKQLESLPPKIRKAWLEGDWNVFFGQFFEEFRDSPEHYEDRRWTHVIKGFAPPRDWNVYRSFDWGYNKPFSCGWWAVDRDGVVYRILELYGCTNTPNEGVKWTPQQVFSKIHEIETEHPWLAGRQIQGVADPAIWDAETGESFAETAAKHQVFFAKGDNKRIAGWMQMHYRMSFDENGYPMLYVFDNCRAFIRTIPLLQFDEHKVEDLDTDGEDHVADESRYFLQTRPIAPRPIVQKDGFMESPLHQVFDINRGDIPKRTPYMRTEIIK